MRKHIYYIFFCFCAKMLAQSPSIIFPNPTPNPANLSTDSYTRAINKINLQPGFNYGFTNSGATNLLNLSLGTNPTFVSSSYLGSGINPDPNGCINNVFNSNKPVGETNGTFNVSASGAANYVIPIVVSPGTKGIQPNLSVAYNSQSGLGVMGNGWSLIGLSSINRTGKTIMHDGKSEGIQLNSQDVFSFDGNRLFSLSGIYGNPSTTYYTENENFFTITSNGTQGTGPISFSVKDKKGNTIEYGNTSDAQHIGVGDNNVLAWYINKLTDEFGNYIKYYYINSNGEILIDKIEYTGNGNILPTNYVKFEYIDLAEKTTSYIKGITFNNSKLLKSISTFADNNLVRKYLFDYQWSNGSYLAAVKEVDSDNKELNPTFFCWQNPDDYGGPNNFQNMQIFSNTSDYNDLNPIPADFNGDGFTDFACIYPNSNGRIKILQNNFKNNYGSTTNSDIQFNSVSDIPNNFTGATSVLASNVLDLDFDNKQEVYSVMSGINLGGNMSNSYKIIKTTLIPNLNTSVGVFNIPPYDRNFKPSVFMYDVRDYDGDGTNDVLRIDPSQINLTTSLGNIVYPIATNATIVRPIRFNNDGVIDFIVLDHSTPNVIQLKVITMTTSGLTQSFSQIYSTTLNFSFSLSKNLLRTTSIGDFNGDGLFDLIYLNDNFSTMYVRYGNGLSFLPQSQIDTFTPLTSSNALNYDLNIVDINGDGKTDITITDNSIQANNSPVSNYFTYYSLGNMIIKGASYSGNWTTTKTTYWYNGYIEKDGITYTGGWDIPLTITTGYQIKADYNGDGIVDIASFNSPTQDRIILNNVNSLPKQSITSIKNPLRDDIVINYSNINTGIFVTPGIKVETYKNQSTTTYNSPLYNYKPNLYCVNSVTNYDGLNKQIFRTKKYIYSDAIYHSMGRGFLGFESVSMLDLGNKIGSVSKTSFNTTYKIGLSTETIDGKFNESLNNNNIYVYSFNNSSLISKNTNVISLTPRYTKGYFISVDENEAFDYLNSTHIITNLSYNLNNNGSLVSKTSTYGWPGQGTIKTTNSSYSYILNKGYFKISSETNANTQTGDSPYSRTTNYVYDPTLGHLTSVINDPSFGSKMLTVNFSLFNQFGSATKVEISAGDVPVRTSYVVFDPTGRFVTKKTNALGDFSEYTYDSRYGNVLTSKDITGLTTQYFYDGLGRSVTTILANGAMNKVSYAWDNLLGTYSTLGMAIFSVKTEVEGTGYTKTYFTGRGLKLRAESQDFAGQLTIQDTKYSDINNSAYPKGEVIEITEPHYLNQLKYLKEVIDYETIYYRPSLKTTKLVNGTSSTSTNLFSQITYNIPSNQGIYNQSIVTQVNQKNQQVVKKTNAAGQIITTQNIYTGQQQNANYVYSSTGKAKTITLTNSINTAQNIVHTFNYNNLGQQSQMIDPSSGTTSYFYNTIGELLTSVSPIGTFNYNYDELGRLITKSGGTSGTQTYNYITSGNGLEMIDNVVGSNSVTEFKYDNLNRIIEEKETIGNRILKTNYTLDKYGRIIGETYPNGFATKTNYNAYGYLNLITDDNNNPIWQLVNQDALGRIKEYNYGNGINTKTTYDDLNNLKEINYGNNSVFKQEYNFNSLTGNLTYRKFSNYLTNIALKENYNFDVIDRLTQAQQLDVVNSNVLQTNNTAFDVLGNITHKDDAGDLKYTNPAKPFNLTQIDNPSPNISLNTINATYTDFDNVGQITEMGTNKQMDFKYGTDYQRLKMVYGVGGVNQLTRYYAKNHDRQETSSGYKEWNYIISPTGLCAINYNNNGAQQLLYTLTDHLGSPILLTNNTQGIVEEYAFDAWGRRRNPTNWSYTGINPPQFMIRGFTMHEHIDEFGLINMNGRVYDPVIARFVQPDKYVQAPDNIQNYNRYAYCLNNPLNYTDPSGYLFEDLHGAFGNFFSGLFGSKNMGSNFNPNISGSAQQAADVAFVYAQASAKTQVIIASTALSAGVGGLISGGSFAGASFVAAASGGALSGGFSGGLNAYIDGTDVGDGIWKGAVSGAASSIVSGGVGGTLGAFLGGATGGGIAAALNGGSPGEIIQSAVISGVVSAGIYEVQMASNYSRGSSGLKYGAYRRVQAAIGRANFWESEASWYEMQDGSITGLKYGGGKGVNPRPAPSSGVKYEAHTHPNGGKGYAWSGPSDAAGYQKTGGGYDFKVYGYDGNSYIVSRSKANSLNTSSLGTWGTDGFDVKISERSYKTYSIQNGLNIGSNSSFSNYFYLYIHR
jgi:RHS repeat-associated protein